MTSRRVKASGAADDVALALATLRTICGNEDATPAAQAGAARTILEFYGTLGAGRTKPPPDAAKADAELTRSELLARARKLRDAGTVFDA